MVTYDSLGRLKASQKQAEEHLSRLFKIFSFGNEHYFHLRANIIQFCNNYFHKSTHDTSRAQPKETVASLRASFFYGQKVRH
jgi:hypothetical protein